MRGHVGFIRDVTYHFTEPRFAITVSISEHTLIGDAPEKLCGVPIERSTRMGVEHVTQTTTNIPKPAGVFSRLLKTRD